MGITLRPGNVDFAQPVYFVMSVFSHIDDFLEI